MNVVALMGRLTADVEVSHTPNGVAVCKFTIAVDGYTNGERKADFINCVAWRETAENIARFFRKGSKIAVNGSIQTRQFQDRETGKNRVAFEVKVDRFHFCEKAEQAQQGNFAPQGQAYGNPRQNLEIAPQPQQVPKFQPQQTGFMPQAVPKFMPQQQATAFSTADLDGFAPINFDAGDRPF